MYFIPLTVIVLSILGIGYVVLKKIRLLAGSNYKNLVYPEFEEKEGETLSSFEERRRVIYDAIKSFTGLKKGDGLFIFMEKFFRKMRVRLMKIENFLTALTDRLHERNVEKKFKSSRDADLKRRDNNDKNASISSLSQFKQGDSKFEENYWLGVLKHSPQSAHAYKRLGEVYMAREDFRRARPMFNYALKFSPHDSEVEARIKYLKGKKTKKV